MVYCSVVKAGLDVDLLALLMDLGVLLRCLDTVDVSIPAYNDLMRSLLCFEPDEPTALLAFSATAAWNLGRAMVSANGPSFFLPMELLTALAIAPVALLQICVCVWVNNIFDPPFYDVISPA